MNDTGAVETLVVALALLESVGMLARNLAPRTRLEYGRDLGMQPIMSLLILTTCTVEEARTEVTVCLSAN